jgi:hypothetical protein
MATRWREATRLTRRAYTLLAALVLADGDWVDRRELAALLFDWPTSPSTISRHARMIERYGGWWIERRYRSGYRLRCLPSDEHLDSVLACVPGVKRSAWWTTRASRIPMTA